MGNDSSEERGGVALVRGTKGMREGGREKNGRGGDHEVLWEGADGTGRRHHMRDP
jgi:hypothetical protein